MRLATPTPATVRHVAERMRERDRMEFMAVSHASTAAELAESLVARYGDHPEVIVAGAGDVPIAVGGLLRLRPNVATLMFFATEDMAEIGGPLTRFIRQRLFAQYRAEGVHRIECASLAGYDEVHRWLLALGLQQEAVMRGYGRGGEDFVQFAWVKP